MADNTRLNPGLAGDNVRTIDRGTAKTQVLALDIGGEASEQLVVGTVPVSGSVTVSGTVAVSSVGGTSTVNGTVTANQGAGAVGSQAWPTTTIDTSNAVVKPGDLANNAFRVNVVASSVAAGGTASTFGAAFPSSGTAVGFKDSGGTLMQPGNLDASGFLKVNVAAGSAGNGAASNTGSAVPVQADYIGASVAGTLTGITATNNGGKISIDANITGGSAGNGAASNTGSAVPVQADYGGLNVAGTLRGQTGVNPTGTVYAAQTDLTSLNGTSLTTFVPVGGEVAAGSSDSGNPVKIGTKAGNMGADPTAVTTGQRANVPSNLHGIPFVQPGHPNVQTIKANFTAAQTDTALVTVAASHKIIVTRSRVALSNASTNTSFTIGFGTASTPTTTGVVHSHPGLPPGLHDTEGDGSGMLGCGADNEDLRLTSSVPTGGSFDVNISYYVLPA